MHKRLGDVAGSRWTAPGAFLALFLVYVLNAWTPSHYQIAAQMLGLSGVRPVFGEARAVRSDEFAVITPYYQIAVASDLGPRDVVSPYHEPLKAFFALPSRGWSMAFTPDLWGFLVLDPAHAYSLHYALLAAAALAGFAILLVQLGCSRGCALAVAAILVLSQFVQAWWTSNAAVLALAPWPAVVFLWRGPWTLRLPALAYAAAAWLIGQLYPPFILAAALGLGVVIAAFRPEALRPARLLPAVLAVGAGVAIAWVHYADLIPLMAGTVYPGRRLVDGGGVPAMQLLAHVFPYLVSLRFEPLGLWPSNACEVAVVGSYLPLAAVCFSDHAAVGRWARAHPWAIAAWVGGLAVMAAWMLVPIPGRFAPGLNLVPPARMLWGFGLALTLGIAVMAARVPWRLTWLRAAAFVAVVAAAWGVSKLVLAHPPLAFGRFDVLVAGVLIALALARFAAPGLLPPRRLVLLALVASAALTFGRFNPVQSAQPIFARQTSPVVEVFRAYAAANPRRVVVAPGMYGAVINGAGVPALNHTLLRPQLAVFRAAYPRLDPAAFDAAFNRYEHLQPTVQWAPATLQPDLLALPPDPFAIPLPIEVAPRPQAGIPAGPPAGALERATAVRLGPRRWGITASGWFPWRGVAPGQAVKVALADPVLGRIVEAHAFRLPRPDAPHALDDKGLFAAGFGVRLEVETPAPADSLPLNGLRLTAVEPGLGERPVPAIF